MLVIGTTVSDRARVESLIAERVHWVASGYPMESVKRRLPVGSVSGTFPFDTFSFKNMPGGLQRLDRDRQLVGFYPVYADC